MTSTTKPAPVGYLGRQALAEPGCGKTPGFLREHGVEVVLGHGFSENAVNHLLEAGIVAIQDAPILSADALIAHLVSGPLKATPPEVAMHGEGGCNPGGCGACSAHVHEDRDEANTGGCGHAHAGHGDHSAGHKCG